MRVVVVRYCLPSDEAIGALVEAGRWLCAQGVKPGLVTRESLPLVADMESRVLAWSDKWTPRMGGLPVLENAAAFLPLIKKLRRRYERELAKGKVPAGAGEDIVCFVSAATVDALAPVLGDGVPRENLAPIWVLEATDGRWRVSTVWPGRAPGDLAPMTVPTARTPRDASAGKAKGRPAPDRPWEEYLASAEEALVVSDAPLLDAQGHRLPGRPIVGLQIDVQWGEHVCLFTRLEILKVEEGQFWVERIAGGEYRFGVEQWDSWLRRRLLEGIVTVHLPECDIGWCAGCDGGVIGKEPYLGEDEAIVAARGRRR
ncbi:hypothetical protein LBMAG42_01000 [Deltaproteobacteria bacterium]|nr:hypothetical protein LBMAG42_01000 [Deltaproteobacteria bacterium]